MNLATITDEKQARKEAAKAFVESCFKMDVPEGNDKEKLTLALTWRSNHLLLHLDAALVGTPDYMGIAYFWSMAYKHALRNASVKDRQRVHDAFLKSGLPLGGDSPEHEKIVISMTRRK